jgi:hypothetical protein
MAKMAEQCTVDFVHPLAAALALGVVSLSNVKRDQTCVVARQNLWSVRIGGVSQHVEGKPFRVLGASGKRKPELQ